MFYQIFYSPQVKRCAIITYKHGIYEVASRVAERLSAHTRIKKKKKLKYFGPSQESTTPRRCGAQCPHKKKKKT